MSKEENKFSVFMVNILTEEDQKSNGGWHHPTHGGTMFISKNGISLQLTPEEIQSVVKVAGGNFRC